jgi:MFS family permease
VTAPFLTGLIEVIGLKRMVLLCMGLLIAGTGLSTFMTTPWQLFVTWGFMVGIGSGAGAFGIAAAVANRWFEKRNGLAMGLLMAANAAGQLLFLPLLAMLAEQYGWQAISIVVTLAVGNPVTVAMTALSRGVRSMDFWLLTLSFGICGFSTNGLINTHLIAYCADRGIAAVTGASVLAALGVFSLIGSTISGWLSDRFNPRALLFWYYSLRGLSLIVVPFSEFDFVSLSIFSIFYGLDWVATGPATFALTNEVFGRRDTPVILSWIFAGHQVGGALAAFGAGAIRSTNGDYLLAFITSGLACLVASLLVLRVSRHQLAVASAG